VLTSAELIAAMLNAASAFGTVCYVFPLDASRPSADHSTRNSYPSWSDDDYARGESLVAACVR